MKKLWAILALIVVLVAAWLGTAWHTGTRIEAESSAAIPLLNDAWSKNSSAAAPLPQIKQISYQRGLLTSHARYAVTYSAAQSAEPVAELDVAISHGPFPLTALQRGQLAPRQFDAHIELLTEGPLKTITGALMNGKPPLVMDFGCSYGKYCAGTGNVPPIGLDLGPFSKNAKLAFGGIEMRFDIDIQTETDYKNNTDVKLLPLSIAGQDFGSGQLAASGDATSAHEVFSWKTEKGESKLTLTLATSRPIPIGVNHPSFSPEDLPQLVKSGALKAELSKPMLVDLTARVISLTRGVALAAAQQQAQAQFDYMLANNPEVEKFIRADGDLLISDWQYADGKLSVNNHERPEILEQIKQTYLAGLHSLPNAVDAPESASETKSAPNKTGAGQ
ncbi:MAG: YdgA family protein [Burkholderiaceae bacterium]|jgi:uncharacterized protein YdgA (DUF945 family)|nr:YdgA family protein [Burkholderiaceae bacterium]